MGPLFFICSTNCAALVFQVVPAPFAATIGAMDTSTSTLFSTFLASTLAIKKKSVFAFDTSECIAKAVIELPSFQQEIRPSLAQKLLDAVQTPAQAQCGMEWLLATWPSDAALKAQDSAAGSMQGQALLDALIAKGADLNAAVQDPIVLSCAFNQDDPIAEHLLMMGYNIPPAAFISIIDPQPLVPALVKHSNFDALRELALAKPDKAPAMWETVWLKLAEEDAWTMPQAGSVLRAISDFPDPSFDWWAKVLSWNFNCRNRLLPGALMTQRPSTHAPAMQAAITQPDLITNKFSIPREIIKQFSRSTVINENGWSGSALDASLVALCKRGGLGYCQDFEKTQNAIAFFRDLNPAISCALPPSALDFILKWDGSRNEGQPLLQHETTLSDDLASLPKVQGSPDPDLSFFCAAAHSDGSDKGRIQAMRTALEFVPLDVSVSGRSVSAALISSASRGAGVPRYRGPENNEGDGTFVWLVHMGINPYLKDLHGSVSFLMMDPNTAAESIEKTFSEEAMKSFDAGEISKLAPFLLNPKSPLSRELRGRVQACVMRATVPRADRPRKQPRL